MSIKGAPRDLLPGDPVCAPLPAILAEATVSLIRSLYRHENWSEHITSRLVQGLEEIKSLPHLRKENLSSLVGQSEDSPSPEISEKSNFEVRGQGVLIVLN